VGQQERLLNHNRRRQVSVRRIADMPGASRHLAHLPWIFSHLRKKPALPDRSTGEF
jgi:hypothetical protein